MKYDIVQFERARLIKGWTQKTLGQKVGLKQSTISDFFSGKNQSPETAKKLADKLELDMEKLVIVDMEAPAVPAPMTVKAERELVHSTKRRA